jgi:nitrogen-specific signal transduction histidine kinase
VKKNVALWITCLFLISGCRYFNHIDTHQLELVEVNRNDNQLKGWIFADLKGDENDFFIGMDSQEPNLHALYVMDQKGKVISQTNSTEPFRSVKVLPDQRDNSRWMFYSFNNKKKVYLNAARFIWQTPLQRENKSFESIDRVNIQPRLSQIEYYGQIIPEILDDLDGDGNLELLCRMIDGFSANPRGLALYDFDSGQLKWRFDTPCNLNSVLCADFDGDGSKEIIAGTTAYKNTSETINGLDDAHGYILVLSTLGKLLYTEKQFSGYGHVYLGTADQNQDGLKEIYAVNSTWGSEINRNEASVLNWNGKRLTSSTKLMLSSTLESYQIPEFMHVLDSSNKHQLHLADKTNGLLVLDDKLQTVKHNYRAYVKQIWGIGDLDRDGNKEIILQTDDDYLDILDKNYIRRARMKNPFPAENSVTFGLTKTGYDSDPLLAIGCGREIRYYRYSSLPFYTLLYRWYFGYAALINLMLLLILGFVFYRYRLRLDIMSETANHLEEGLIVSTKANKIAFCNIFMRQLAQKSADPHCRNLLLCFPNLHAILCRFIENNLGILKVTETLNNGEHDALYNVTIFKIHNLRCLYIMTISPAVSDTDAISDKIHWADTARRLSHHVRRHITNIILALDALSPKTLPENREYYGIVRDEIEKVRVFTHAFQRFTELKDYDLKLQDIVPSVEHCLARCTLPASVKVVKSWSLKSVLAFIEPIRFEEAIQNMINNSSEAMPKGGTLHVCIKEFPLSTSPQGERRIMVEIEDSGLGIPAKYMEDIWKPFFTTNQSGTGIGIPETKKIMDSMGGVMDIQSEEGIGTTVTFWLKGSGNE